MEALDFVMELKRLCKSNRRCADCVLCSDKGICYCNVENLEGAIPLVEQWSKEHPKVTNLDHYAEELERIGYKVEKDCLHSRCPIPKSTLFLKDRCPDISGSCSDCRKWWDEEYKEK